MNHICLDGRILPANEPALLVSNRSYRYGDGLFETMKVKEGKIILGEYHLERLFSGLALLEYDLPAWLTKDQLEESVLALCEKNNCRQLSRVRLSLSRGNGNLTDPAQPQYVIEC